MINKNSSEEIYKNIGILCIQEFGNYFDKILLYAEVAENFISSSLFIDQEGKKVRYMFCSEELESLIYQLWEGGGSAMSGERWRCLCYIITGNSFDVSFVYKDGIDPEDYIPDRRHRVLTEHFPSKEIDYSNPENDR